MPKFARRSYAKKFKGGKSRSNVSRGRRLQRSSGAEYAVNAARGVTRAPTARTRAGMYNLRGSYGNMLKKTGTRGRIGASKPDAASGASGGRSVGRARSMGSILRDRRAGINRTLADAAFPVIKDHSLDSATQLDWPSSAQVVKEYGVGYTCNEVQNMVTQAMSAQSVLTPSQVGFTVGTEKNIRMDIYDKITKLRFKNTCSHTVYVEIRAYVSKIYHGYPVKDSWELALAADNMLQGAATFGTEQLSQDIGNRPDFAMADMNVRWRERKDALFKITLEPGQETFYTYVQKGGRFDQAKFNVTQGNYGTADDVNYLAGLSSSILVFARAEMVADSLDNDVSFGSGHIAVNRETWKSWAAVPQVKPVQTSFTNGWGTVIEANELDINQYQANNDVYEEQV